MSPAAFAHKYANNRVLHGTLANLPADASSGFGTGCQYINMETGDTYINLGTTSHAIFRCNGVNWFQLTDYFPLKPGVNGNRDVPAGDTYNTAQMQLGLDKHPHFELLGLNMTSALCTHAAGGGITLTTAGGATDGAILLPHLNTTFTAWATSAWNTDRELRYQVRVEVDTLIADETIHAGFKLTNTPTIATDNDQTFFRFKDDATGALGLWQVTDSNNNTDTSASTGVTVVASTAYVLTIQVDTSKVPRYYVNGVLKNTGVALKANTALIPYVGILSDTSATAKAVTIRSITCGQSYA